jgi:hypothetical protein
MAQVPATPFRSLSIEGNLNLFSVQAQWENVKALLACEGGRALIDQTTMGLAHLHADGAP